MFRIKYKKVYDLKPIYKVHESRGQKAISFNVVKAKYYSLNLQDWLEVSEKNQELLINFIVLNSSVKLDQFEEKLCSGDSCYSGTVRKWTSGMYCHGQP